MDRLGLIVDCAGQVWRVRLGDPDQLGLLLTAGYVLATLAMLAVVVSHAATLSLPRERLLWVMATLAVLLLALNKQLDLQLFMARIGRCVAETEGSYLERFGLQRTFALWFLAVTALSLAVLAYGCRGALRGNLPLLLGLGLMAAFLMLRVSRSQHLDQLFRGGVNSTRLHRMIEASGLVVLVYAALRKRFAR